MSFIGAELTGVERLQTVDQELKDMGAIQIIPVNEGETYILRPNIKPKKVAAFFMGARGWEFEFERLGYYKDGKLTYIGEDFISDLREDYELFLDELFESGSFMKFMVGNLLEETGINI